MTDSTIQEIIARVKSVSLRPITTVGIESTPKTLRWKMLIDDKQEVSALFVLDDDGQAVVYAETHVENYSFCFDSVDVIGEISAAIAAIASGRTRLREKRFWKRHRQLELLSENGKPFAKSE